MYYKDLLNELRKSDKMCGLLFRTEFNKSIIHEHECEILLITWHSNYLEVTCFYCESFNTLPYKSDICKTKEY